MRKCRRQLWGPPHWKRNCRRPNTRQKNLTRIALHSSSSGPNTGKPQPKLYNSCWINWLWINPQQTSSYWNSPRTVYPQCKWTQWRPGMNSSPSTRPLFLDYKNSWKSTRSNWRRPRDLLLRGKWSWMMRLSNSRPGCQSCRRNGWIKRKCLWRLWHHRNRTNKTWLVKLKGSSPVSPISKRSTPSSKRRRPPWSLNSTIETQRSHSWATKSWISSRRTSKATTPTSPQSSNSRNNSRSNLTSSSRL